MRSNLDWDLYGEQSLRIRSIDYRREIFVFCDDVRSPVSHLLQIRPSLGLRRPDLTLCTDASQQLPTPSAATRGVALGGTWRRLLARRQRLLFGTGHDNLVARKFLDKVEEPVTRHLGDTLFVRHECNRLLTLALGEEWFGIAWPQLIEFVDNREKVLHQHLARAIRIKLREDTIECCDVFFRWLVLCSS